MKRERMKRHEKILSYARRYYFDFHCKKCGVLNTGWTSSDSPAGNVEKGFGMDCHNCAMLNEINFSVKFFKIVEIEISREEWEKA